MAPVILLDDWCFGVINDKRQIYILKNTGLLEYKSCNAQESISPVDVIPSGLRKAPFVD